MLHYHELVFLKVEGVFYTNETLEKLMFDELKQSCRTQGYGGFLPGMKQIGNVAALPGIVGVSQVPYSVTLIFCFQCKIVPTSKYICGTVNVWIHRLLQVLKFSSIFRFTILSYDSRYELVTDKNWVSLCQIS